MVKRALCLIRQQLVYRRDVFCEGLEQAGYRLVYALNDPRKGDVLVIWNRYGKYHFVATRFERAGATVVVAENGYINGAERYLALAKSHHSGAGQWNVGGPERWDALGIALQPWRTGKEVVVLGQRGIGEPGIAAPRSWAQGLRIGRVRPHPGNKTAVPLEQDLVDASAVVTWSSAAALRALAMGIPVFCAFPEWIGMAASTPLSQFPKHRDVDRLAMFRRLSWAQWTLEEIRSGEAFRCLLRQ